MKKLVFAAAVLCLAAASTNSAQQPQPVAAVPSAPNDCAPGPPKKPSWAERHIHIKVPDKLQREINQQTQSMRKKTGVDVSPGPLSADALTKQQAKPCTQPAANATSTSKQ